MVDVQPGEGIAARRRYDDVAPELAGHQHTGVVLHDDRAVSGAFATEAEHRSGMVEKGPGGQPETRDGGQIRGRR